MRSCLVGKYLPAFFPGARYQMSTVASKNSISVRLADPFVPEGGVLAQSQNCVVIKNEGDAMTSGALITNEDEASAAVLTMHEKYVTAAFLNKVKRSWDQEQLKNTKYVLSQDRSQVTLQIMDPTNQEGVPILDLRGREIGQNEFESKGRPIEKVDLLWGSRRKKRERKSPREQLLSGNVPLDFSNPIIQGTISLFKGKRSTGKTSLALATGVKHLSSSMPPNRLTVYVSSKYSDSAKVAKEIGKLELNHKQFVCFCPEQDSPDYIQILTFHAASEYARYFSEHGKDVLLIVDGVNDLLVAQHRLEGESNLPVLPKNFLNELAEMVGCGEPQEGSLTSILVQDSDTINLEYALLMEKWSESLVVLANSVHEFGLQDPSFRHILPKIGFSLPFQTLRGQSLLLKNLSRRLSSILLKVESEKNEVLAKKAHGIELEPWDYYNYYDSKYYMGILNQTSLSFESALVLVHFVVWSIENEEISKYKLPAAQLAEKLAEFQKEFKRFPGSVEEEKGPIDSFLRLLLKSETPENVEIALKNLEFFSVSFSQFLRTENLMHEFQNDYFK